MFSCSNCVGKLEKRETKGLFFLFGSYGKVKMTKECMVDFCDQCFEVYPLITETEFDEKLEQSISDNVSELLSLIKDRHHISLRTIAGFLNIEADKLLKYKNQEELISTTNFLLLKQILKHGNSLMETYLKEEW